MGKNLYVNCCKYNNQIEVFIAANQYFLTDEMLLTISNELQQLFMQLQQC